MRMKICLLLIITVAAIGLLRALTSSEMGGSAHPKTLQEKLRLPVPAFESDGRSMVDIVLDLAYRYHLPLSLQYADEVAVHGKLNVKLQNRELREVLSAIISRLPGYKMTVGDGVIQIFSPKGRAEASNLLNTRIPDFEVHAVDTHEASADLACSLARQINPRVACFLSIAPGQWGPLSITLHMQNAKVYEILDAIVGQNGAAVWTVLVPPDDMASLGRDLWYIYPLKPSFKRTAIERLKDLFPLPAGGGDIGF